MASPYKLSKWAKDTSFEEKNDSFVYVYDRRSGNKPEIKLHTSDLSNFAAFKERLSQALQISSKDKYVVTTTNRELITKERDWENVEPGDTLYVLQNRHQELCAQTQEKVTYLPHYDTIVKGGMYEYYASEGQNPIPYAFAELIDNSLTATSSNKGPRKIELVLHLDMQTQSQTQSCIWVTDNGQGMTSHQLNNWAVYRLSKFNRKEGKKQNDDDDDSVNESEPRKIVPRSLNSDISYFGVGGKQAIFFIGNATRMISKSDDSKDVHELTISKEDFERKEKNKESIYSGVIRNRKVGDTSHLSEDQDVLKDIIKDEVNKESFTTVVINGINPQFVPYLKLNVKQWTRQLAHIYHYYIHGPSGNQSGDSSTPPEFSNLDIKVKLYTRISCNKEPELKVYDLRDIYDDMQSLYIKSTGDTFEFKASADNCVAEGILRYHPFLYDSESFPSDKNDPRADVEMDDHDYSALSLLDTKPARGKRPMFECFWNGRLIPYTSIEDFEWCRAPKKSKIVPAECFNRVSGVLWTNEEFQVSTNKLTFIDLEVRLKDKDTVYTRIMPNGSVKRTSIEKEFLAWLNDCHANLDKQVLFSDFKGLISRPDLPKTKQHPWATYEEIEWDGRKFKKGQLVRISRTLPVYYGAINRFMLHGDHGNDVYATGGDLELTQEPKSMYDDVKIVPLNKLDRYATDQSIMRAIAEEETKLPAKLVLEWPDGDGVSDGDSRPAGKRIGDMKIEILNKRGEQINRLPGHNSNSKKLLVELKVIWHAPSGNETVVSHISQHGKTWPYWFKKMENIKKLGSHSIQLNVVLNESGVYTFAGIKLPSLLIKFNVVEAEAQRYTVGQLDGPFKIGTPFDVPLEFVDSFGNFTTPSESIKPELKASGLQFSYKEVLITKSSAVIHDVTALGAISSITGQSFSLSVSIPGMKRESQSIKMRMLPGSPYSLMVLPDGILSMENGDPQEFDIEVHDVSGNLTTQPKLQVVCKFTGSPDLPTYTLDCSNSGQGCLKGPPITLAKLYSPQQKITASIHINGNKSIKPVERSINVRPSHKPSSIKLMYENSNGKMEKVENNQELQFIAGETIKKLEFTLTDESNREVELTNILASKIKVNWTAKCSTALVLTGGLPEIKVPTNVSEVKFCHVSLQGVVDSEIQFHVKAICGEPSNIKCQLTGSNSVRMGETLSSDIQVNVTDHHGNTIKKLEKGVLMDLSIEGPGLVLEETVRMLGAQSGFNISGIRFDDCAIGSKELKIKWRDMEDYVRINVVAGLPTKLTLNAWDTTQPITLYNDNALPRRLIVQLCDDYDNPSTTQNVKIQLAKDPGIKFTPAPQPLKADKNGRADFGILVVSGKRGVYDIQAKAFVGRSVLSGPKLKVAIQPDPTRPVSVKVDYDSAEEYIVGQTLPEFKVTIINEEDSVMTTCKPNNICMRIWNKQGAVKARPPANAANWQPDSKRKNDQPGNFHFTKRTASETAGIYSIMFMFRDGSNEILSEQVSLKLSPGPAQKMAAIIDPGTPTVSNTRNVSSRTLLTDLQLQLLDKYNNITGQHLCGTLQLEIMCKSDDTSTVELPTFDNNTNEMEVDVVKGIADIKKIVIAENTAGQDGQEYMIRCTLNCPDIPKNMAVTPYDINFFFYNDVKKQAQMASLTKERDNLKVAINTYKSLFQTTGQLIDELKLSRQEAVDEENKVKSELRKYNITVNNATSASSIAKMVTECKSMKEKVLHTPRRMCGLQPANKDPQVLGKIAHLAEVEDNDIARVLSWHMSADMDCVITMTTPKAKELYSLSNGRQQVLPLDSIFRKNLPDWRKPLPHERCRLNAPPSGNPIYARNLLTFPNFNEQCRIVFGMLLGDTIILDTLDDANSYRQEIVKHTHCPTILTREGDRIRSNGKFGGLMNKALPLEKMKGVVFSAPISNNFEKYNTQVELLTQYKAVQEKRFLADEELKEQLESMNTDEMKSKQQECKQAQAQLSVIEKKLVSPVRGGSSSDSSEPPTKKSRQGGGTPRSQSGGSRGQTDLPAPTTPQRQSKRTAAISQSPQSTRKRAR